MFGNLSSDSIANIFLQESRERQIKNKRNMRKINRRPVVAGVFSPNKNSRYTRLTDRVPRYIRRMITNTRKYQATH